jgi:arsenate reductase
MKKLKILFLCAGNACRSRVAEGWARHLRTDLLEPSSAGIETHSLNSKAVRVMAEVEVDISGYKSKRLGNFHGVVFDFVITVCGNAHESCSVFPGEVMVVRVPFDNLPRLAKNAQSEGEALAHYRRVRDEICEFVETLPGRLEERG